MKYLSLFAALLFTSPLLFAGQSEAVPPQSQLLEVKAISPDGQTILEIKAVDQHGNLHEIEAFHSPGYEHKIKAIINGQVWDVKAITHDGKYLAIKALGNES